MQRSLRVLRLAGAFLATAGSVAAQSSPHQAPTQTPGSPVPGFSTDDPRPGTPGSRPASSGSNVGAGAIAAPVGNGVMPPGAAPNIADAPKARPLLGLSPDLP